LTFRLDVEVMVRSLRRGGGGGGKISDNWG
jgi:hypothetical protein